MKTIFQIFLGTLKLLATIFLAPVALVFCAENTKPSFKRNKMISY